MSRYLQLLLTPFLIVCYWQLLASSGLISQYLLPAPLKVWQAAIVMWQSGVLQEHITISLIRVFQGFSLSCVLGIVLAGLVNSSLWIERLLEAPITLLRMIPPLAMMPLLILWLGIGNTTQLAIIILSCVFPIFLNTRDGLKRVDPVHRELAKSLHLSKFRYLWAIVAPSAVPSTITGLRLAFGYSWRALVGAELISASAGLGYLIVDAQEMLRTDEVIVGILIIGILGWILDAIFYQLSSKLLKRRFPEVAG